MKFKKRYALLFLAAGAFVACKSGYMSFRKDEAEQSLYLVGKGQAEPQFFTYQAGDRSIHYTYVGNDSLPLVVMVHGSPGSSSAMLDFLADPALTAKSQVVAVDRPGFGWSDFGKAERSLAKQSAALAPVLEKHRSSKTILVGHSYGGPLIVRMAIDFPDLVDGLVIVAGSIDPDMEPRSWWQKPLNWRLLRWMLPPALRVSNQEILPLYLELEEMMPAWEKITCPVTIIHGTEDKLVTPLNVDFAKKMLKNSSRLEVLMVENQGHFVFWEKRDLVVQEILKLIEN